MSAGAAGTEARGQTDPGDAVVYESTCPLCQQTVSADSGLVGRMVKCPHCGGQFALSAPPGLGGGPPGPLLPAATSIPAGAQAGTPLAPPTLTPEDGAARMPPAPIPSAAYRFRFTCTRCESVLESQTDLCGQPGKCPTCATEFIIPLFDPQTGALGELTNLSGQPQDPTPVHAYAAAGARAPEIIRDEHDEPYIRCPRCEARSPVDANRCEACGLPFTLEGVTHDAVPGSANGYAVASLVLGILGLPCFMLVIPQILAVVFGIVALTQHARSRTTAGRGMAITGIVLGVVGLVITMAAFMS